MHKERILPWQEHGRWYHAFIESDGTHEKLTLSDLDGCTVSGTSFVLPNDFHAIDVKYTDIDLASGKTLTINAVKTTSAGKETFVLPSASDFTYCEIWFFGYAK